MKLFLSTLGFLFILAWLIEMWVSKHRRARSERERKNASRWWEEPRKHDDLDGDY